MNTRKPNNDEIRTYNTMAHVGNVGERAQGKTPFKIGTWLCPRCSKTHVTMYLGEGDGAMELNFALTAENAEFLAHEFMNPNPIALEHVIDARDNNNGGDWLKNPPKDNLDG